MDLFFSDVFKVNPSALKAYGAFNISLVSDLPLFVDPFLIFNSHRPRYKQLHRDIVKYLQFLYDKAQGQTLTPGLIASWYRFPEIEENWLGFSKFGNEGRGLGPKFAGALHGNLGLLFNGLNTDHITKDVHLEKLCLVSDNVGRDNISDFATNLTHGFLLEYTSTFAQKHIDPALRRTVPVQKVRFNYITETWETGRFDLPIHQGKHVLLTPWDLLTKDDTWINKTDLIEDFDQIPNAIPDEQLRHQIGNYFQQLLPKTRKKIKKSVRQDAIFRTIQQFPQLVDYYIKYKEEHGDLATKISDQRVQDSAQLYVEQVREFVAFLSTNTQFYSPEKDSYEAAHQRALYLKDAIENKGCQKIFYVKGKPIHRETDLHILYRLTWFGTAMDVTREANDGRGPVDFKVSKGAKDKSLVEMKLASNSSLEQNLRHQTEIYQKASDAPRSVKIIIFFSLREKLRVDKILKKLKLAGDTSIVLIDARPDNKPTGSKARAG